MRCETFLSLYDGVEPGAELGQAARRHLGSCPACRAAVERAEAAVGALRAADPVPAGLGEAVEERVMAAVRLAPAPRRDFSLREWIVAGSVIAASMVLVPVGDYFNRFKETFGASYTFPLSLVLGLALSAYGALFVGSHMDEVQGFVERRVRQH